MSGHVNASLIAAGSVGVALGIRVVAAPLARISIHPPDRDHPEIWRQILRLTDRLMENRNATTYRDWIAEKRVGRQA